MGTMTAPGGWRSVDFKELNRRSDEVLVRIIKQLSDIDELGSVEIKDTGPTTGSAGLHPTEPGIAQDMCVDEERLDPGDQGIMLGYTNDEKKDTMSFTYTSGARLVRRIGDL